MNSKKENLNNTNHFEEEIKSNTENLKINYMETDEEVTEDKGKDKKRTILAIILIAILILLLAFSCERKNDTENDIPRTIDKNSQNIETENNKQQLLNQNANNSMINISMNTYISVNKDTKEANLFITNKNNNKHPQFIEIFDTNGTLIYKSDLIPVGKTIKTAKLQKLPTTKREECTAIFNAVNTDTSEIFGKVGVKITLVTN